MLILLAFLENQCIAIGIIGGLVSLIPRLRPQLPVAASYMHEGSR